jgi:hypothetical protein
MYFCVVQQSKIVGFPEFGGTLDDGWAMIDTRLASNTTIL